MRPARTLATAGRVVRQLLHDHRSLALILIAPSLLVGLFAWLFAERDAVFQQVGPAILALFPFIVMFLTTSIATLRERRSGTLERLLTTPLGKGDFIAGYALAFALAAVLQALITVAFAVVVGGLDVQGELWLLAVVAVVDAILGTALGLLASAFARTEFQVVQFLPVFVFPQILIGGIIMPRDEMPDVLHAISDWLPLSHAVDAVNGVTVGDPPDAVFGSLGIVGAFALAALVLAGLTLRRRTD